MSNKRPVISAGKKTKAYWRELSIVSERQGIFINTHLGRSYPGAVRRQRLIFKTIKNNFDMTYIEEGEVSLSNTFS